MSGEMNIYIINSMLMSQLFSATPSSLLSALKDSNSISQSKPALSNPTCLLKLDEVTAKIR